MDREVEIAGDEGPAFQRLKLATIGQPATIIRHVGNQVKNGLPSALDLRREMGVVYGHFVSFH